MTELFCILGMCGLLSAEPQAEYVRVITVETVTIIPDCIEPQAALKACKPEQ